MAINITQSPTDFYPAYNDSYIKFTTNFTSDDRSVITITGTSYQFTIYPNSSGEYLFNLKHIIKALINPNNFNDNLDYSASNWGFTDNSLYKELDFDITAYGDETSEVLAQSYSFNKAVKQFGDRSFDNPYQLMLPSEDGVNYNLTYWEGYPMELPFRYLRTTDNIRVLNTNTNTQTEILSIPSDNPFRLFIDKGSVNWLSEEYFMMPDLVNKLHILESDVIKTTINLDKKNSRSGVYLKWFNADGSYSYYLFNQYYSEDYGASEFDRIATNDFTNIYGNSKGSTAIIGKEGDKSMKLKTNVEHTEFEHLKSIITSPMVQMWSSYEPYSIGDWLDVKVNSKKLSYNNKKYINQISIEIELPEVNTQTT